MILFYIDEQPSWWIPRRSHQHFLARIHNGRRRHDAPTPMLPTCACCCHGTKMQCAIVIISSVEFAANLKLSVQAIEFWIGNHAIYIKWIRVIYIYALEVDVGLAQDWIHPVSWKCDVSHAVWSHAPGSDETISHVLGTPTVVTQRLFNSG